ncbi:MAG: LysM peptidoglycan-binding domain-containing protein [Chthoniobacterales bacterium]
MKLPAIITRKKKLSAATARRSRALSLPDEMDYEEMSEPNMKLSRALLIVLVLHIVAVAGIVAFNTIKTREDLPEANPEVQASADSAIAPGVAATAAPNEVAKAATPPETKAVEASAKPAATVASSSVKDSGKTYTVVKGDNPVTIARHHKVSEADLLQLNQITDPRRLQINQKLRIPEPRSATKAKAD